MPTWEEHCRNAATGQLRKIKAQNRNLIHTVYSCYYAKCSEMYEDAIKRTTAAKWSQHYYNMHAPTERCQIGGKRLLQRGSLSITFLWRNSGTQSTIFGQEAEKSCGKVHWGPPPPFLCVFRQKKETWTIISPKIKSFGSNKSIIADST